MPRLPQPGGDQGNWGSILNQYLSVAHKQDGTLKDNSIPETALTQSIQTKLNTVANQQGATGPQGPQGASGPQGPQGPAGATGTPGTNGTNGQPGATGASGTPGTPGVTGATGPQGPSGTSGAVGATGPQGPSGTPGTNGQTGATGPAGNPATNLVQSVNGLQGAVALTANSVGAAAATAGLHRWEIGDPVPSPLADGIYWIVLGEADAVPGWVPAGSLITRLVED